MKNRLFSQAQKIVQCHSVAQWLWWLAIGLFIAQASTVAVVTKFGVPPDEENHISFIDYYTDHTISPFFDEQAPTLHLGDKTREVDYLYHYSMSLLRRVLPFSHDTEFYVIRFCGVGLAVLTFIVWRKVFRKIGVPDIVSTLLVFLASTMSMVLLMSSAVNNDVLVWLGVALGSLLILRLVEKPRLLDLLWLASVVAYAGLMKRTLLPIALVFALIGIVFAVKDRRTFLRQARRPTAIVLLAAGIALGGVALGAERIVGNVVRYGTVTPSCSQVQGEVACQNFWWNIRERELAKRTPGPNVPIVQFVFRWMHENLKNVLDIQTQFWRHERVPAWWVEPIWWVFLVVGLFTGVFGDLKRFAIDVVARKRLLVLGVTLAFITALLLVNYSEYQRLKFFGLALNGRYMLAGFLPLIGLVLWYWSRLMTQRTLRIGLYLALLLITAWQSGLWLLLHNPQLIHG